MSLEKVISAAIISHLESQGMSKVDMVLKLAEELGVSSDLKRTVAPNLGECLRLRLQDGDEPQQVVLDVAAQLGVNLDDITGRSQESGRLIRHGDSVQTDQGPARAVILQPEEHALLSKLMDVARAA